MEKINAINRVPVNVLGNGAIRYGIYNENGELQEYTYIKKEDAPSVAGTKIDKTLFDLIDNNMVEVGGKIFPTGQFTLATLSSTSVRPVNENIIPTSNWTQITAGTKYSNGDITIQADSYNGSSYTCDKATDSSTGYWQSSQNTNPHYWMIDFGRQIEITKFNIQVLTYQMSTSYEILVQGSNDGTNWDDFCAFLYRYI